MIKLAVYKLINKNSYLISFLIDKIFRKLTKKIIIFKLIHFLKIYLNKIINYSKKLHYLSKI